MNTILVPVDFSETSDNALNYAIGLANYLSAKIILLHVDSIPLVNNEFQDLSYVINKSKEENIAMLNAKAELIKKDNFLIGEVDYFAESGELKSQISNYILEKNIDFLVMGVSGHNTVLGKVVLGSNAVSVSRESNIPVFIVPKNCRFKKITNIAYASEYDTRVIEHNGLIQIKYINAIFGSLLYVLHIIPNNHLINEQESQIDSFVEQKLDHTNHRTFILTDNSVSTAILDFINAHNIDLVVLEQKEHSFLYKLFHTSATKELAFNSPVPILTIHN
jgi:nucleotide-binding universal stress UspA family protein